VIPSRDESIPMIFKEAARFGVPAVAADVGDLGAFVREYNAGILVPPNDAPALAQAMQEMLHEPREKYRARLDDLAAQFDLTRSAEKLLSDLEKMINN
jgi:glycosyltransferase involved in cell wall biosynthesis